MNIQSLEKILQDRAKDKAEQTVNAAMKTLLHLLEDASEINLKYASCSIHNGHAARGERLLLDFKAVELYSALRHGLISAITPIQLARDTEELLKKAGV